MTKNNMKTSTNRGTVVQFISENEVKSEMGESFASYMLNPTVTWAKFILTDDQTNANGERIPKEEFANLILSGVHMPVKMALGEISGGHPGTKPLGTITHLKEVALEDGASAIVALAALWGQERPADVEFLKQRMAEQKPVEVSWEILYEDSSLNEERGSRDLLGTILRAATVVGNPAYEGRTPFLTIAAKKKSEATLDETIDDSQNLAEDTLNEIEQLKADMAQIQQKLDEALAQLEANKTALSEKDAEIARLTDESATKETELTSLKEFKASIDAEKEKNEKLDSIKNKFKEAGIEKGEDFFTGENAKKLLEYSDEQLDFMIQELKVFAEAAKTSTASTRTSIKVPALINTDDGEVSVHEMATYLKNRGK